jgi:putative sterol carrier protein
MGTVPRSGYDARLSSTRGTLRFDVTDGSSWRMRIDAGHFEIFEGTGDADLVLRCDDEVFVNLVEGRQNFVTALLRGLIRAQGDLTLALNFHGVLRGPSTPRTREAVQR